MLLFLTSTVFNNRISTQNFQARVLAVLARDTSSTRPREAAGAFELEFSNMQSHVIIPFLVEDLLSLLRRANWLKRNSLKLRRKR